MVVSSVTTSAAAASSESFGGSDASALAGSAPATGGSRDEDADAEAAGQDRGGEGAGEDPVRGAGGGSGRSVGCSGARVFPSWGELRMLDSSTTGAPGPIGPRDGRPGCRTDGTYVPEILEVETARVLIEQRALERPIGSVLAPDAWFLKRGPHVARR